MEKEETAENVIRWIMLEVEEMIGEERDCREYGEGVNEEENQYALVGMDAVALFPSMSGRITAEIVRRRVMESRIQWEGFNWRNS